MLEFLRRLGRNLPTFLLAFALSLAVWVSAVTASDPTQELVYPNNVPIEVVGLDPGMVLISDIPRQVTITLSAPQSIWNRLVNEPVPVRAIVDISGLGSGTYQVPVQVQIGIRPVRIVSHTPETVEVTLEELASRTMQINLVRTGEPAIGFRAEDPVLNRQTVTISGSESLVEKAAEVRATLDINRANENIERSIELLVYDEDENIIQGLTITPDDVVITQRITQRGGYRNVVVKVVITGQVADGYRVTNISVYPPAVTVFSSDPKLVDQLPGYVETEPLDLGAARDDLDVQANLNLPPGISVVGEETVEVQVGVAAIEGSVTIGPTVVEVIGLQEGLAASVSPETVDVILSGPLPVLDALNPEDISVFVEMAEEGVGTYQRLPQVEVAISDINVESILPGSLEITISVAPTPTPTPRP